MHATAHRHFRLTKGLDAVAEPLDAGQPARAMIRALLLDLPELDWAGAARLAKAQDQSEGQPLLGLFLAGDGTGRARRVAPPGKLMWISSLKT